LPASPAILNLVYIATGGGGLFKTTDSGVTWKPLFDRENTISIGNITDGVIPVLDMEGWSG
jgi:hypothetical protein